MLTDDEIYLEIDADTGDEEIENINSDFIKQGQAVSISNTRLSRASQNIVADDQIIIL